MKETVDCSWCQASKATRNCFKCKAKTCRSKRCGVFTIPEITGENQVWICQRCIAEGFARFMNKEKERE